MINMNQELTKATLIKTGVMIGVKKGWRGFLWMMTIVLPVSLLTTLLDWSGWLHQVDFLIAPVMKFLSLPTAAALPLMIGMAAGIYGGIAAMVVLPLNEGQMTLIGIFLFMAHNLIQEGIVQGKSGINPLKTTLQDHHGHRHGDDRGAVARSRNHFMGLGEKVGLLWTTAIIFGLTYGGAVIVEEAQSENISKEDLEMLHLSIGINHSMVEDPPLFISLGLNAFWLYIPRLVVAVIMVHLIRLWRTGFTRLLN